MVNRILVAGCGFGVGWLLMINLDVPSFDATLTGANYEVITNTKIK